MAIKFVRLHVDEAGESHMASKEMPLVSADFAPPAPAMDVSATEPAVGWRFLRLHAGWVGDWHPTPRRIWIFCLAGAMEFKSSDGSIHAVEPGSVMLLEDTGPPTPGGPPLAATLGVALEGERQSGLPVEPAQLFASRMASRSVRSRMNLRASRTS